ncbi:MAG TPA: hypothetical protein VFN67_13415 [Polyangiales bacterium]|nr:hypothetical protein [Polyangiales bacterium]
MFVRELKIDKPPCSTRWMEPAPGMTIALTATVAKSNADVTMKKLFIALLFHGPKACWGVAA